MIEDEKGEVFGLRAGKGLLGAKGIEGYEKSLIFSSLGKHCLNSEIK